MFNYTRYPRFGGIRRKRMILHKKINQKCKIKLLLGFVLQKSNFKYSSDTCAINMH